MLRKSMALFMTFVMLLISCATVLCAVAAVRGDVNSSGYVNTTDYLLVKRYVLGTGSLTSAQKVAADVDNDGNVDSIDYIIVKRIALGSLESSLDVAEKTPVSYSKSYTTSRQAGGTGSNYNSNYDDTYDQELTDGSTSLAADFMNESFVGFDGDVDITINIGSDGKEICGFELSYLNIAEAGIYSPLSVTVYGGNSQYSCNTQLISSNVQHVSLKAVRSIVLDLDNKVNYSYIRFSIKMNTSAGAWMFLDEAVVYSAASSKNNSANDHYMNALTDSELQYNLDMVYSDFSYDASKGRSVINGNCSVSASSYDPRNGKNDTYLTDRKLTGAHFGSVGTWVGIGLDSAPSITWTVRDYISAINVCGFAVHCFNRPTALVNLPDYVDVSVSKNGYDFYTVGRVYAVKGDQENYSFSLYLETVVEARSVRFTFPSDVGYMWVEEVEVYVNNPDSVASNSTTGYLSPSSDKLGGADDIFLVYHNNGVVNEEMLLPYVAYLDDNGNVVDTMFDGYLFLPRPSDMKCNGHTPWCTNCAADWKWYYDEMFKKGYNLDALNSVAGRVETLLGKSNFKVKVFITIPHMDKRVTNFGDINGDGVSENITTQDGRVATAKKYAQMFIDAFNSHDFDNLELCGFYWFHETISNNDYDSNGSFYYSEDADTVPKIADAIQSLGMEFLWIPYYNAEGYLNGYSFGFDAVCLQPNYTFQLDVDESRLESAANIAKQKGYCIEIEISPDADVDPRYFQKYMDYLSGGVKYGYMNNSIHIYYSSFDTIADSRNSDDPRARLIYKYTYEFIKGTLDVTPEGADVLSYNAAVNTALGGSVNTKHSNANIYKLSGSPCHGSIAFAENGSFVYYPNKGFKGTDSFTYKISNYLGWSTECTVTIKVS